MASITTRQTGTTGVGGVTRKNAPLTNTEIDQNFINLNDAISGISTNNISNGTSLVQIPTLNGNISVTRNGSLHTTFDATGITLSTGNFVGNLSGNVTGSITSNSGSNSFASVTITGGNIDGVAIGDTNRKQAAVSSLGVGTATSGVAGEIRATDNITAYFSSDIKFKENVRDIDQPLEKVVAIGGKYFDWTDDYLLSHGGEDNYFLRKQDFGVIAQDVQKVFPVAVRTKSDGSLAVDYEKLCVLAFAAIKQLEERIKILEDK